MPQDSLCVLVLSKREAWKKELEDILKKLMCLPDKLWDDKFQQQIKNVQEIYAK